MSGKRLRIFASFANFKDFGRKRVMATWKTANANLNVKTQFTQRPIASGHVKT